MKALNPFFIIGTVGVIVTAIFHVVIALVLSIPAAHTTFFVLYPMFISFLAIGAGQIIKHDKAIADN
ncbi:hypothetical protein LJ707_13425 [Mucilaginibacter sp. UR6-1]|uniref:hypothetical protein n=1 Tax=Mucilaginibacter sp. UR6-1 TaxID=1435643 RepID=UPI001E4E3E5C|nr:hypothetical protein [Mucilaginibacter sp. UR6-1]MCC8409933.1 hypothetical protein [Mucilaginibacter sp. UR6-1]